jgi:hypothetical protein
MMNIRASVILASTDIQVGANSGFKPVIALRDKRYSLSGEFYPYKKEENAFATAEAVLQELEGLVLQYLMEHGYAEVRDEQDQVRISK